MGCEVLARLEVECYHFLSVKYLAAHRADLGDPQEQADSHIGLVFGLLALLLVLFFFLFSLLLPLYRVLDLFLDPAVFLIFLRACEVLAVNADQLVYQVAGNWNHFVDLGFGFFGVAFVVLLMLRFYGAKGIALSKLFDLLLIGDNGLE